MLNNETAVLRERAWIDLHDPQAVWQLEKTVLSHSYPNRQVRLAQELQIAYRSDLQLAMQLMEEAARKHPRPLDAGRPGLVDCVVPSPVAVYSN